MSSQGIQSPKITALLGGERATEVSQLYSAFALIKADKNMH